MLQYYEDVILASYLDPAADIAGVFFDEVDHFVMPRKLGGRDFYHCDLSPERKAKVKRCFIDAMVRLTDYLAVHGKYAIMSTKALMKQYPDFYQAQRAMLNRTKAFYYQEMFCPNSTKRNPETGLHYCAAHLTRESCCIDMINTAAMYASAGVPTMIRAQAANENDRNFRFLLAAFLLTAQRWSYIALGVGWYGAERSFPWFSIYDLTLGPPLTPLIVHDAVRGVYMREFRHAVVHVNVSAWEGSIDVKDM